MYLLKVSPLDPFQGLERSLFCLLHLPFNNCAPSTRPAVTCQSTGVALEVCNQAPEVASAAPATPLAPSLVGHDLNHLCTRIFKTVGRVKTAHPAWPLSIGNWGLEPRAFHCPLNLSNLISNLQNILKRTHNIFSHG